MVGKIRKRPLIVTFPFLKEGLSSSLAKKRIVIQTASTWKNLGQATEGALVGLNIAASYPRSPFLFSWAVPKPGMVTYEK